MALAGALALAGCAQDRLADYGAGGQQGETVTALMRAADAKSAEGDHRAAATLYRSAHEADPDERVAPLVGLGRSLSALGAPQDAAEAYRKALSIDDDQPEALRGLGNALVATGQPALASGYFEQARAVAPEDWRIDLGQGAALDLMGEHAAAQAVYRAGLAKAPDQPDLISNLALSLALTGEADEAITRMRPIAERTDAAARHRQTLSLIYGLAGEREAARRLAEIDLTPREVEQNLDFYETLRGFEDPTRRLRAIRARTAQ
ncbi:MAG: tetratricopeptide repeat protein [Marivibrio sp.]|uniref:tetratricopeptide repeat protein n=1 Tax=Marivibrio sp. TaxID=2039719 RepID=UPI0032EEDEF1